MKDDIKYDFSLPLAIVDILPCIFFGVAMIVLGSYLKSVLFIIGAVLCTAAGLGKVLFKILIVCKDKTVLFLSRQLRVIMPLGMALIITALFLGNGKRPSFGEIVAFIMQSPSRFLLFAGFILMAVMMVLAFTLDQTSKRSNWIEEIVNTIAQFLILLAVCSLVYAADYYHYAETVPEATLDSMLNVNITQTDKYVAFVPAEKAADEVNTGFVFYPGGKVAPKAYYPLLETIADRGIIVVMAIMPDNLAIYDVDAADALNINDLFPSVNNWYIGGHSLGGVAASMYLSDNDYAACRNYKGIIFMGAYPSSDLKDSGIKALCINGSEDKVMDISKYEESLVYLPSGYTEYVIEGGCHSYFGDYGMQEGDGQPSITPIKQWELVADAIELFVR